MHSHAASLPGHPDAVVTPAKYTNLGVTQLRAVCATSRAGISGLSGNGSAAAATKAVLDAPLKWDGSLAPNAANNAALFRAPAPANVSAPNTRLRLFSGTSNPVRCNFVISRLLICPFTFGSRCT